MLATTKGIYSKGVIVFNIQPNLQEGEEVVVTYETMPITKPVKKEWGFEKISKYLEKKYGMVNLSDAVIEERNSYR